MKVLCGMYWGWADLHPQNLFLGPAVGAALLRQDLPHVGRVQLFTVVSCFGSLLIVAPLVRMFGGMSINGEMCPAPQTEAVACDQLCFDRLALHSQSFECAHASPTRGLCLSCRRVGVLFVCRSRKPAHVP